MKHVVVKKNFAIMNCLCAFALLTIISMIGTTAKVSAATVDEHYPGLAMGLLKSAVIAPLDDDTVLTAGNVVIKQTQLMDAVKTWDPKLHQQLEKNLILVLERDAIRRILIDEAKTAGIETADEDAAIQALFEQRTKSLSVTEEEARTFYEGNKEMLGGAPFDQVSGEIRQYMLQDKRQQAVSAYVVGLGEAVPLRINKTWIETQSRLAMDNPVDKARRSGKPTLIEFGATGCVPCDMMQPILDNLRRNYPEKLNVVFVHVGEEQILAARYGIQSIPVQVFFDAKGSEVFRHVGFFAEKEVVRQLEKMGVAK